MNLGALIAVIGADVSDFTSGLAMAHRSMRNFQDMVEGAGEFVIDSMAGMAEAGLEMVKSLQLAEMQMNRISGSAETAAYMMDQMKNFAVETPYNFDEVQNNVTLLNAYGIALEDTMPLMQLFGDTVASTSRGSTDALRRLTIVFTQMLGAGKVMTQDMNQFANVAGPVWDLVADSMGKSVGELRKQVKEGFVPAGDALKVILQHMFDDYSGAMESFTKTLPGAITAAQEDLTLQFGESLIPLAEEMATAVPQIVKLLSSFGKFLSPVLDGLALLADYGQRALVFFNELPASWQNAAFAMVALGAAIAVGSIAFSAMFFAVSATVAALISMFLVIQLGGGLLAALAGLLMAGLVVATLTAAAAILALALAWNENLGDIQGKAKSAVNAVLVAFRLLRTQADTYMSELANSVVQRWKTILKSMQSVVGAITPLAKMLKISGESPILPEIVKKQHEAVDKLIEMAQAPFDSALANLEEFEREFLANGRSISNMLNSTMTDVRADAVSALTDGMNEFASTMGSSWESFMNGPMDRLMKSLLPEKVYGSMRDFIEGQKEGTFDKEAALERLFELLGLNGGAPIDSKAAAKAAKELLNSWARQWGIVLGAAANQLKPIDDAAKEFADDFEEVMTNFMDDLQKKYDATKELRGMREFTNLGSVDWSATLGNLFNSQIGSAFSSIAPEMTSMLGSASSALGGIGGPIGALISIIITLSTKLELLVYFGERLDSSITKIVNALNKGFKPSLKFVNVIMDLVDVFAMAIRKASGGMKNLMEVVGWIGAALVPLLNAFRSITGMLSQMSNVTNVLGLLEYAMWLLFDIIKGIAVLILTVATAFGLVWNAMLAIPNLIIDALSAIPGLKKALKGIDEKFSSWLVDTDSLMDATVELTTLTWEQANAQAENTESIKKATDAFDQLLNVPEGYKVALARFTAAAGGARASGIDTSSGVSGGGTGSNDGPLRGGSEDAQGGSGGKGQDDITARSRNNSGGIYIEHLSVNASTGDELFKELMGIGARKNLTASGRSPVVLTGGKFVAG